MDLRVSVRQLARYALVAAFAGVAVGDCTTFAGARADCRKNSIAQLEVLAPDAFAIYTAMEDKKFFLNWITCEDVQLGLSTAVHESVHHLTADRDAFPLIDRSELVRPHEVTKFFAPSVIAARFAPNDFVTTYLRPGNSSSATDFLYLLDELNAYSHDLNAAVELNSLRPSSESADHRDGLAALMAFVAVYVETAEESHPDTWRGLQQPAVAKTVSALWGQAEGVMASSCGIPDFGTDDRTFIRHFCEEKPRASLRKILGRAPVCPVACLKLMPRTAFRG